MRHHENRASCRHLTYKYASFYGCTLEEMGIILGVYAAIEIPILIGLALLLGQYVGGFFGALLLLFLVFALLTFFIFLKQTAKRIGKARAGRPAGYLKLQCRKILYTKFGTPIPYVIRRGHWSTRRKR